MTDDPSVLGYVASLYTAMLYFDRVDFSSFYIFIFIRHGGTLNRIFARYSAETFLIARKYSKFISSYSSAVCMQFIPEFNNGRI